MNIIWTASTIDNTLQVSAICYFQWKINHPDPSCSRSTLFSHMIKFTKLCDTHKVIFNTPYQNWKLSIMHRYTHPLLLPVRCHIFFLQFFKPWICLFWALILQHSILLLKSNVQPIKYSTSCFMQLLNHKSTIPSSSQQSLNIYLLTYIWIYLLILLWYITYGPKRINDRIHYKVDKNTLSVYHDRRQAMW